MYLDPIIDAVRQALPMGAQWPPDAEQLLRLYALLAVTKGRDTTLEDVHNAWSLWQGDRDPDHPALVPFDELPAAVRAEDEPFRAAVRAEAPARL